MSDLAASVRARLLNIAKAQGADFNQVLVRFALERILYRMSQSEHADRFLLKGALLFTLWYDMPHRATRDADLLGFGASDLASVAQAFRDIAAIPVADGIEFDPASVVAEEIRKDATYPVLLADLPAPRLRTYPVYTVIAEKFHAIALLGMANTRMKDYFDLSVLLARETLDAGLLASAIRATFERRGMEVPTHMPTGLTEEFSDDATRQALWRAFLRKNDLAQEPLEAVVHRLRTGWNSAW